MKANVRVLIQVNSELADAFDKIESTLRSVPIAFITLSTQNRSLIAQYSLKILSQNTEALTESMTFKYIERYHVRRASSAVANTTLTMYEEQVEQINRIAEHISPWNIEYLKRARNTYNKPLVASLAVGWTAEHLPTVIRQWVETQYRAVHPN